MFSHRLKSIRKFLGLSQRAFAKKVGVDQGRVSQWESNKSMPGSSALSEMAILGVNINWLLIGEGEMMKKIQHPSKSNKLFSEKQKEEIKRTIDEMLEKNLE